MDGDHECDAALSDFFLRPCLVTPTRRGPALLIAPASFAKPVPHANTHGHPARYRDSKSIINKSLRKQTAVNLRPGP
jgi:hypothetical protein